MRNPETHATLGTRHSI